MTRHPDLRYERKLWRSGIEAVAGVDEAGVGPMAGPVVAAAVIFAPETFIKGVHDSKQLAPDRREELYVLITARALVWGVGVAEPIEIDRLNIYWATREASLRALAGLGRAPGHVLVDGRGIAALEHPQTPIVGGLDPGQGDARPHDVRVRRAFPGLRFRAAQGLLHARAFRGAARARTVADPSALLRPGLRRRTAHPPDRRFTILSALS
jgi:hypothetical protein